MRRLFIIVATIISVVIFQSRAMALIEAEARYWLSDLDAEVKVTESGLTGTTIDMEEDLGVDREENFLEARLTLQKGKHSIRYAFVPMSWDGKKTIPRSINFAGRTYSVSTAVTSSLDVDYHRLGYQYDFMSVAGNRLGIIAELKYLDIDASLKSATIDESESLAVGFPAVGVAFRLGLPALFSIEGELTGMTYGGDAHFVDGEVGLNIKPMPLMTISGGYRYLQLYAENDDDKVDLELTGPFIMFRVGF